MAREERVPSAVKRFLGIAAGATVLLLAVAACSGGSATPTPETSAGGQDPGVVPPPLVRGPVSEDGVQAILATPDLGTGTHRLGFLLTSDQGFVQRPSAELVLRSPDGAVGAPIVARGHAWPLGIRTLYAADLTFDRAGEWTIDIAIEDEAGETRRAELAFQVPERPSAPAVGSRAPASRTKTLDDTGGDLSGLTTGSLRDPDFYRVSLSEAIVSGRPTVLVIASPAFCTNATCGPILEMLQTAKDRDGGEANFVHQDFFDNPSEIEGDLSNARVSQAAIDWGVKNAEWTFVIDGAGLVTHKFEGYVTLDELEAALAEVA